MSEKILDKIAIHHCESIYIDELYIYYKNNKYKHNNRPYNTLKLNLNVQEKKELDAFLRERYERSPALFDAELVKQQEQLSYKKHFVFQNSTEGIEIYKIVNGKQLAYLTNSNEPNFEDAIIRYMTWKVRDERFSNMTKVAQRVEIKEILLSNQLFEAPIIKKISNDPNEYCLCYIDINNIVSCETPAWDNFLYQFECEEYKEIFMAWVYSIFIAENRGRQICWIYGKGKSGKSTIGKVLYQTLFNMNPALSQTVERQLDMDKYSMAAFENCRLIVIGDCSDRGLVYRHYIKNITGSDVVAIRKMHSDKKSAEIHCRILATANSNPYVNIDLDHELTRMLYLRLDDAKCYEAERIWKEQYAQQNWGKMLAKEVWGFIAKCKPYYDKWLCYDNENFDQPAKMIDDMSKYCTYYSKREISTFFECNISEEKGARLLLNHIVEAISKYQDDLNKSKVWSVRSFLMTFLRNNEIEVKEVGAGNALYIEGYRLNDKQITLKEIIERKLHDIIEEDK